MDGELAGLLRACKAEPFDDARRLVLADWLEEHCDADRAELVRIQVRLAGVWGDQAPGMAGLRVRAESLLRVNAERWLGEAASRREIEDRGGFLSIGTDGSHLADAPDTLSDAVIPWLEELQVHGPPVKSILSAPWLRLFSRLVFRHSLGGGAKFRLLLSNPALEHVSSLDLTDNKIGPAEARILARCEGLAGLRELNLGNNPLGDDGAKELARAPWLGGLQRLNLGEAGLGTSGFKALIGSKRLTSLRRLGLSRVGIDTASARVLARNTALAGLQALDLASNRITAGDLRILADVPHLRPASLDLKYIPLGLDGLRILLAGGLLEKARAAHFGSNGFTPETSARLLSSPRLASIQLLSLWDPVGDAGCQALATNERAARLRRLDFSSWNAGIGPAGAAALGRSKMLGSLESLSLRWSPIGPDGLAGLCAGGLSRLECLDVGKVKPEVRGLDALVGSGMASRLRVLSLREGGLGDPGAKALAKMASSRLVELDLTKNGIGPAGAKALAGCPGLASLAILWLSENRLRDTGVKAIKALVRRGNLLHLNLCQNGLTAAGAKDMLKWPHRERMALLWIDDVGIRRKLIDAVTIR